MTIVCGIDPAAGFGYAFYDLSRPPSAIESASLKLKGDILDKLFILREEFVPLLRQYKPVFAAVEEPFRFAPKFRKQPKRNLLTGVIDDPGEETTINPSTISDCGQIAGAATALLLAWNVRCCQVRAQTWQGIIPASIKGQFSGEGAPKKRMKSYCDMLRINSPNIDSRDACGIALWCAGHAQELKLLQLAGAA